MVVGDTRKPVHRPRIRDNLSGLAKSLVSVTPIFASELKIQQTYFAGSCYRGVGKLSASLVEPAQNSMPIDTARPTSEL